MNTTKIYTRQHLIAFLVSEVIDKTGSRFVPMYRFDYKDRISKKIGMGLERAGARASIWNRGNRWYKHAEQQVIDELMEKWPTRMNNYGSRDFVYIGAKKILELMGVDISTKAINEARKQKEAERTAYVTRNVTQNARSNWGDLDSRITRLVELGAVSKAQAQALRDAWANIDAGLPETSSEA